MEKEKIEINGMKFKAVRLLPNYEGRYTCKCEECIFDKDCGLRQREPVPQGGLHPQRLERGQPQRVGS